MENRNGDPRIPGSNTNMAIHFSHSATKEWLHFFSASNSVEIVFLSTKKERTLTRKQLFPFRVDFFSEGVSVQKSRQECVILICDFITRGFV